MKALCWIVCAVLLMLGMSDATPHAPETGECYDEHSPLGTDYRGSVNYTDHGVECQAWTSQEPHEHDRTEDNFPDQDLGDHNYCRNPDGEPNGPWCYTTDPNTRWAFCDVGPVANRDCDSDAPIKNADYWMDVGREEIEKALKDYERPNTNIAKNVVLMIGDGLDLPTATAARIHKAGVDGKLNFELLPFLGKLKTYNSDSQVPDSGSAATAMFTGVKTISDTLGVDSTVEYEDCSSVEAAMVYSVLDDFIKAGKSTGIVTTAQLTDATPAALYGHTANRKWENDADLPEDADGCVDLAAQFLENAADVQVVLAGGRQHFLPENVDDPEYPGDYKGKRTDGRNLIEEWLDMHDNAEFVRNIPQFNEVDSEATDYLLGLFQPNEMHYESDRGMDGELEPHISEMTRKALEILQKNDEGYFLMVEAGQIDDAHHEGKAQKALRDTIAFDFAVEKVMEMVDLRDTLVIVTSDHAQALSISGYSTEDNPILGLSDLENAADSLPFTTLQYSSGPGGILETEDGARRNLTDENTAEADFVQSASVPLESSNHNGQDVPVFAAGPMAHMFHKTHEQNFVAHVIRMAACLGEYEGDCSRTPSNKKYRKNN